MNIQRPDLLPALSPAGSSSPRFGFQNLLGREPRMVIYLTFACTKGWSPGALSRTTAGNAVALVSWERLGVGREGSSS